MKFNIIIRVFGDPHPGKLVHQLKGVLSAQALPRVGEIIRIPHVPEYSLDFLVEINHVGHELVEGGVLKHLVFANMDLRKSRSGGMFETRADFTFWLDLFVIPNATKYGLRFVYM